MSIVDQFRCKFGKVPLCNEIPDRAPHIGGFCFPLCWRCTMIDAGLLLGALVCLFIYPGTTIGLASGILVFPCIVDGLLQTHTSYESSNAKRIVFGFVAGFGMFLVLFSICKLIMVV